jgi:hypothetical protein
MTRREWTEIAEALGDLRTRLESRRKMRQALGVALATRTVCRVLRRRSSRFDSGKFLAIATSANKRLG